MKASPGTSIRSATARPISSRSRTARPCWRRRRGAWSCSRTCSRT